MSPIVKQKKEKFTLSGKYLLLIFTVIAVALMIVTYGTTAFDGPFNAVVGYVVVPFEKGISKLGSWLGKRSDEFTDIKKLLEENNALKEELDNEPVVAKFATTAADGKIYQVEYFSLEMITSVGYRVKSKRGVKFRRWSNKVLSQRCALLLFALLRHDLNSYSYSVAN